MTGKSIEDRLRALEDRTEIIDLLCRFASCIDRRRWEEFATCFDDVVDLNVIRTKQWVQWTREDLIARLRKVFESYTATQHISANHQVTVEDDQAVAWSTLNATHHVLGFAGGEFQQQVGYYEYHLVRRDTWRINKVRQVEHWQVGNQEIFDRTLD